ncbi:hypothetical protein BDV25DRAFT_168257 [Aspergillus avenaceus]|uniref:T6SS Phospholipase effector Tle1-like catalytic domain-containing protein n=1 Tax=Aspergillus avenaceus TaxID=36643 RepID=A0A5N6TRJ6_ASPAV|nr:hypothetical protein BDV25DRAFT_168257 [Aspergillus avenaceus]
MSEKGDLSWSDRKRLIVCCDGTWENSTSDSFQPPTNVTRLSRSISREAVVKEDGVNKRISQIVYYQKGVGTGLLGDKLGGGAIGLGLSSNVRSAYGFLADNYDDGDEIFFFGFSRGAYTARAVAGLVTNLGLLTARGMDNFTAVYNDYYEKNGQSGTKMNYQDGEWRARVGFRLKPLPQFTVRIIGVWDTVGFHDTWLGRMLGEQFEVPGTALSPDVKYAFQALALDEARNTYKPVLWHLPEVNAEQELLQVWFSGYHSDVGGGASDPGLSDITLAWMVSQCTKDNQLAIDLEYFYDRDKMTIREEDSPWATSMGDVNPPKKGITRLLESFKGQSPRTPLQYPGKGTKAMITNEKIHESIRDRNIVSGSKTCHWPCRVVKARESDLSWLLSSGRRIEQLGASRVERELKGRIRRVHPTEWD